MSEEIINEEKVVGIEDELLQCKKEKDEYLDGWKRAKADLINYKKEETARLEKMAMSASERTMHDLIPILDSFDLGIASIGDENPTKKGMLLIRTQLEDALRRQGLTRIAVTYGEVFNPAKHEAIGEMVSEYPEGSISEEVERGYELWGKVIRPVRVRIAKKASTV
ncbi:MAG: nucleotide exchange factor GrpE [Candidatus Paceibacterota bacterium]|jgi:molecular chaperone GrpE